jgi:hypothetical protein
MRTQAFASGDDRSGEITVALVIIVVFSVPNAAQAAASKNTA